MERGMSDPGTRRRMRRGRRGLGLSAAAGAALLLAGCNQSGRPAVVQVEQTYGAPPSATAAAPAIAASGDTYTVIPGDTLYRVADRFQVPIRSMIELNELQPPYRLMPGTVLRLPVRNEYRVQPGDTVESIARHNGVDVSTLTRLNGIAPPYSVEPGQVLLLPAPVEAPAVASSGGLTPAATTPPASSAVTVEELPPPSNLPAASAPAGTAPPAASSGTGAPTVLAPAPSAADATTTTPVPQTSGVPLPQAPAASTAPAAPAPGSATPAPSTQTATTQPPPAAVPQPAPLTGGQFLWPVNGKIIAGFGAREGGLHNDGINVAAPLGTPIRAAENGVVAYAGNELRGFGNMLLIRHADGWMSAYAHADSLLVKRGDNVVRGQTIGRVGQTGNVSTPQLHFELRRGTDAVDPTKYLGELGAALPLNPGDGPGGQPGLG
jgi:murein DD-endopeptidase MepM/ murein hydrolase activator NlpD